MATHDEFNLRLENVHKTVKVKSKPTKKQPEAKKAKTIKPVKPKEEPKPVAQQESPTTHEKESPISPQVPSDIPPAEINNELEVPQTKDELDHVEEKKTSSVMDKTLDRKHKIKNTFTSVFPAYGLSNSSEAFQSETKMMCKDLKDAEPTDWSNHLKMDSMKRYTEEMLKAANMRGAKK